MGMSWDITRGLGGAVGVIAVDNYGDTAHFCWDTGPLQLWLYNVI